MAWIKLAKQLSLSRESKWTQKNPANRPLLEVTTRLALKTKKTIPTLSMVGLFPKG
jgi:hypothetical protein